MAFRKLATLLAAACALPTGAAQAEKLAVEGVYAARTDGARGVDAIAIEPIQGPEGFALEHALVRELGSAHLYGEPYFRLLSDTIDAETSAGPGSAQLRGYVESRIYDVSDGVTERTTCLRTVVVGEGQKKECVERLTESFECRRLHVEFRPEIALLADEGALYQRRDGFETSQRYCADSSFVPSADVLLDPLITRFARAVRLDLAPQQRFNRFRILESRKGLKGADRKAFKQAIRLTKTDPEGACLVFEDILSRNPYQRSALYNAALCREAAGELELASDAYAHLIRISDKSRFRLGLARVESRFAAREQLAARDRKRTRLAATDTLGGPAD